MEHGQVCQLVRGDDFERAMESAKEALVRAIRSDAHDANSRAPCASSALRDGGAVANARNDALLELRRLACMAMRNVVDDRTSCAVASTLFDRRARARRRR